jgi:hypothetical protein
VPQHAHHVPRDRTALQLGAQHACHVVRGLIPQQVRHRVHPALQVTLQVQRDPLVAPYVPQVAIPRRVPHRAPLALLDSTQQRGRHLAQLVR